ncbi:MAG: hypothetical protein HUK20_13500 [Fibrobacter sp.]|nr:hypothetical protein [Fibrobacter sp.]
MAMTLHHFSGQSIFENQEPGHLVHHTPGNTKNKKQADNEPDKLVDRR